MKKTTLAMLGAIVLFALPAAAQKAPKRAITQIAGDLYRFQNNYHYSVFYVTPAGVIVTDPINADAARWLKSEISRRFNKPVRYVVYSHDHADHSSGGEVFAGEGAIVVAHYKTGRAISGEKRPTAMPEVTFAKRLNISLGGRTVELIYTGKNHSDNMIVMRFPKERVLFAVDFIPVRAVAFKDLPDAWLPDWLRSLRRVERMDFDILAPGHGPLGTRADVTTFRNYMSDLYNQTLAATRAGKSLEETKQSVDLSKYSDLGQYRNWYQLNIEGAYKRIQMHRRANP